MRRIQSSRIVVHVHILERNHSCFDILLIYYFLLKIYFSGCFDEVREGCGCFQIIRGFLQIGAEKWAIVAKMPQLTSQPLDADLMVIKDSVGDGGVSAIRRL